MCFCCPPIIAAKLLLNRAAIYKFDGITKENPINNEEGGKTTVARDSATPRNIKLDERRDTKGKSKDESISTKKESLDLPLVKDKSLLDKINSRTVANVRAVGSQTSTTFNNKIVHEGRVKKSQGLVDDDRPLKRPKLDDRVSKKEDKDYKDSSMANTYIGNEEKDKNHVQSFVANVDRVGKSSTQTIGVLKDKSKLPNKSVKSEWLDKDPCISKVGGKSSLSNVTLERSANAPSDDDTNHYKLIEVTCRPNLVSCFFSWY